MGIFGLNIKLSTRISHHIFLISYRRLGWSLAFGELYPAKYFGGFIYFISHAIKNRLKNTATLAQMEVPNITCPM
jgi:hypothetical protein